MKHTCMFATDVSYASDDSILESLILHTLPDFGPHGDGIINTNFLISFLKDKDTQFKSSKRFRVVDGGQEFWKGILKQNNTNFKWQGHTANMTANLQDTSERLRFPIKTFTGSIVVNKLHEAQNKGRAMMKNFARTLREQAETTIPNEFNSAFWRTSTAGSDEPTSLPDIVSATPTTGSLGGVSRNNKGYMQNGAYTTAVTDIGSEAGVTILTQQMLEYSINSRDLIDAVIMPVNLYAGLQGYLSTQNRFRPDERMAKLNFESIKLGNASVSFENTNVQNDENTITSNYVYGINSNYLSFDVLKDGNFIWNPEGFERVGMSLNKALYFWAFCNLTTNLPRAHFVMTSVSTT